MECGRAFFGVADLCARAFTEDEAQSVIIRGFMDVEILSLPDTLKQEIQNLQDQMLEGMF